MTTGQRTIARKKARYHWLSVVSGFLCFIGSVVNGLAEDHLIYLLGGTLVHGLGRVGVDVHRDTDVCVAEPYL